MAIYLYALMASIGAAFLAAALVFFQMHERPLPPYLAVQPDGQKIVLSPNTEPSLLPETILRFASKAATIAYTFDFVNYNKQIDQARPFFTPAGWTDYKASISALLETIVARQLFVSGVVAGVPVISNEGPLPGIDYAWRVQIPFLVTYQSANTTTKRNLFVILTVVRVSTAVNPQGIGIDQFIMV